MTIVDKIIDYEMGLLNDWDTISLFATLIKNGQAWTLQVHYGRTAKALIESNWIDERGCINMYKVKENGIK